MPTTFWCAAVVALVALGGPVAAQQRTIERIPTRFVEEGRPVDLAVVVVKPEGKGPFPALVFHHGSVSNGDDPAEVRHTADYPSLARFFNERGWLVLIPQRRGRGQSAGRYAEGWDTAQGRYACDPAVSLAGLEHGLEDLDEVMAHVLTRTDVDLSRVLIGGHSKGGALSLSHAARRPGLFIGALNFVGGWVGQRCASADEINDGVFRRAAVFAKPTLWLYGKKDPTYRSGQPRRHFEAFLHAGGQGDFHLLSLGMLRNDHQLVRSPQAWQDAVARFLDSLEN